jgi:DNA recombination-mediator protein A
LLLWLRGTADLRLTCVNSVAIVGSRAATGYGNHVAIELAAVLAERGIGVVSGGAYVRKPNSAPGSGATHNDLSCRRADASKEERGALVDAPVLTASRP